MLVKLDGILTDVNLTYIGTSSSFTVFRNSINVDLILFSIITSRGFDSLVCFTAVERLTGLNITPCLYVCSLRGVLALIAELMLSVVWGSDSARPGGPLGGGRFDSVVDEFGFGSGAEDPFLSVKRFLSKLEFSG